MKRRAFAMPLVLVVVLIAAIAMAALIERSRGRVFFVRKQLDSYTQHHSSKGLQEAISAWIGGNGSLGIRDALDDRGKAFDIKAAGQTISVFFDEAQGTALAEFSGLNDQEIADAAGVIDRLSVLPPQTRAALVRKHGPLAVSVTSATEPVLRAVCETILQDNRADELVREIAAARNEEGFDDGKLRELFTRVNAQGEESYRLQRLLVAEPVLWLVTAEVRPPSGLGDTVYYEGPAVIATSGRAAARNSGSVQRSSAFIDWKRVEKPSRVVR